MKPSIHLICNAHLDPVWLWEWEEGAGEALATFRIAADFCEQFDGFVFNHNEALLYRWVEEYAPELFARIRRLVAEGRWHIMGGWHVQSDCNMPAGESLVRQILHGKAYFREKFGVEPTTAINFDPFGHSRGLVQILAKSGYDSYVFCRPDPSLLLLPGDEFTWVGYDGSTITASRPWGHYLSDPGKACEKVEGAMRAYAGKACGLLLWGVGNHGGGPSRKDLKALDDLIRSTGDWDIRHSTPEAFFTELRQRGVELPIFAGSLNPAMQGCYTSQARVKQAHRQLENALYLTEKMAATAWAQGLIDYPAQELTEATRDLLLSEFHDALPGSSIQSVEKALLNLVGHGLETLSRVRARAFFALGAGQPAAQPGDIPILVFNPHPYPVRQTIECELSLPDPLLVWTFTPIEVYRDGLRIPAQVEQHVSNHSIDWRKRVVFHADLPPGVMSRFDCRPGMPLEHKPAPVLHEVDDRITFTSPRVEVIINARTGLVDRYAVDGTNYLAPGALQPVVMTDDQDPWGSRVRSFTSEVGHFTLVEGEEAAWLAGLPESELPPVRVIEEGDVRTVVEATFRWGHSFICRRYFLPKIGTELGVETRVYWNEKDHMLKLEIPLAYETGTFLGQAPYGVEELPADGSEAVAQKWAAAVSADGTRALTCIRDGGYGLDCTPGLVRLSLLRSPAYAGLPLGDYPIVPQDRFTPRIDQGERVFHCWLNAGPAANRLAAIDREALARHEQPVALACFPDGHGQLPAAFAVLDDSAIQLSAMKKAEAGDDLILRLFNPTGTSRSTTLTLPALGMQTELAFGAYEIKTLRVEQGEKTFTEADLLERKR